MFEAKAEGKHPYVLKKNNNNKNGKNKGKT
jgi:hypothetical protein